MQGQTDTQLSETGRAQAAAVAARLASGGFTALYSSDLSRALDTARAVSQASGKPVVTDARLRERVFGIFEGLTREEIAARYPAELARFFTRDPDYVVPGGESMRAFHARCLGCLVDLAGRHPGQEVVVVTHGLVLDAVYRAAHGLAPESERPVPLINASLNVFVRSGSDWRMEVWGDIGHLDEEQVTQYKGISA
jgi:probable phosphoglycerate mutase